MAGLFTTRRIGPPYVKLPAATSPARDVPHPIYTNVTGDLRIPLRCPKEEAPMEEVPLLFKKRDVRFHVLRGNLFVESKSALPGPRIS